MAILTAEAGNVPHFTPDQVDDLVHFIMGQPDRVLVEYFERVPRDSRMRAFRRVARIVHPDKCSHPLAKDAFQKLLRSSKRLKSNNGSSIFSSYIIRILIKNHYSFATTQGRPFEKRVFERPQFVNRQQPVFV
jgi:hypothetical protein